MDAIFETVKCNFCNSSEYSLLFKSKDYYNNIEGEFSVVKCNNCSLVYTNPRPTPESIHKFYPDTAGYYQANKISFDNWKQKILFKVYDEYYNYSENRSFLRKLALLPFYLYSLSDNKSEGIPKYVNNGKLLDIGCSYGNFLYKMKTLGWNVRGLEFNKKAAEYGINELNLDISVGSIEEWNTNEKFDVVTMRMVLEHVFNPISDLEKIYSMLNPKGKLIFSIPNFDGYLAKLYKQYAYTLQIPTHFTHFTPKTVSKYVQKAGFKNVKIVHQQADRDLIAPLTYMKKDGYKTGLIIKILSNKIVRKTLVKAFIKLLSITKQSSRITVYAEKNKP